MRRVTQLFILVALAALLSPAVASAATAYVRRLPRRSELPVRDPAYRDARPGEERERHDRSHARDMAEHRADPACERVRPVRPRLPLPGSRRARAEHAGARHGGADHDLGHAEVGERQQDAQLRADQDERSDRVRARRRLAVLGAVLRLPVRALLLDLERVEPAALPGAAVRREGQVGRRRATTRSSPPPGTPASRRATRARRSPSGARPRRVATSHSRASRPRTPRAASHSSSRLRIHG